MPDCLAEKPDLSSASCDSAADILSAGQHQAAREQGVSSNKAEIDFSGCTQLERRRSQGAFRVMVPAVGWKEREKGTSGEPPQQSELGVAETQASTVISGSDDEEGFSFRDEQQSRST
eukprot:420844-Amphidinium_carterae.1